MPSQLDKFDSVRSRTHREAFAEQLKLAHREFVEAQRAVQADPENESARQRYASALFAYDRLQATFLFTSQGVGDVEA